MLDSSIHEREEGSKKYGEGRALLILGDLKGRGDWVKRRGSTPQSNFFERRGERPRG